MKLVRASAIAYRADLEIASALDKIVLPALAGAALIDFLKTSDEQALLADLKDILLRVLARAISAKANDSWETTASGYSCLREDLATKATEVGYSCTSVADKSVHHFKLPITDTTDATLDKADAEIDATIEARYSPAWARRTCVYQAAAAILQQPADGTGICRLVNLGGGFDLFETSAGKLLTRLPAVDHEPQALAQWSAATITPLGNKQIKLSMLAKFDADEAYSLLANCIDAVSSLLVKSLPPDSVLLRLVRAAGPAAKLFLNHRPDDARRTFLLVASSSLQPYLETFLDDFLGQTLKCVNGPDASELKCGVRVLIEAVYDPIVSYISISSPSEQDRTRLTGEAYRKVLELDVLSRTPILFNVGLGLTVLTRDSTTAHFTLLDKIGYAPWRWGKRNQFEAGFFAGGFLDAIVRTATNAADTTPYWLLGGTVGCRSLTESLPIGIEVHLAAGLPFDPDLIKSRTSLAWGVALIVPADIVFGK